MDVHETYMKRCLDLARNGLGTTYPNPIVGCVIVHQNRIIGEGWHRRAGDAHAEVLAIASVADQALLRSATIYVSLEPCSHFGKTPPCADLILSTGIPNVVIGITDPNSRVAGEGIRRLRDAGRNVITNILSADCADANRRFFTFHQKRRPYVILKWAQTSDGYIAPAAKATNLSFPISNNFARQLVHKWRSEEQAILIGTQTAIDDNPSLTVRHWTGNNPVRIVIDKSRRIPKENSIFGSNAPTLMITGIEAREESSAAVIDFDANIPEAISSVLFERGIISVMVEGGRQTLQTFIDAGIWDEARVFISPMSLNGGTAAPAIRGSVVEKTMIASDQLLIYRNHD